MSRIGKKPVAIPSGVTVEVQGTTVKVSGPKGELSITHLPQVSVTVDGDTVVIEKVEDTAEGSAFHGLTRQLVSNMVEGVSKGFEKQLEIIGVGYKCQIQGKKLVLQLGFSHPVEMQIPEGIEMEQGEKNNNILIIKGIDKQKVGQIAAEIRSLRPPEPYKGKGVRYIDEHVRRKQGKAAGKTE